MRVMPSALALLVAAGCQLRAAGPGIPLPLDEEGELLVYAAPLADFPAQLEFTLGQLAAAREDSVDAPLELIFRELSAKRPRQRLLAQGRLSPGRYGGLLLSVQSAVVTTDEGPADLLLPPEPVLVPVAFEIHRRRATVLSIAFRPQASGVELPFDPRAVAALPAEPVASVRGYCASPFRHQLLVFDQRQKKMVSAVATRPGPRGLALDGQQGRLYVALAGEDQLVALDALSGAELGRARLMAGDDPLELALVPARRLLLSVNRGSRSVSFVDPASMTPMGRVEVGEQPSSVTVDRDGQRAYVFNTRSNSITVLDLASQSVVSTLSTEPEPLWGRLDRQGTQLYVVQRGSESMTVYSVPQLVELRRVHVGLGASFVEIDPANDLVYVASETDPRVQIFDPFGLMPVDTLELPGPVSYMAIDDLENTLYLLVPSKGTLLVVDLPSRRVLEELDVGPQPYGLVLSGERN